MRSAVNLAAKLAQFDEPWSPRTVATFNGHDVMLARFDGDFVWHRHDDTDDFFLVLEGDVTIRLHDGDVTLGPGELFVVPQGVEHQPCTTDGASVLLIEPTGTPNTGDEATSAPRIEL
ncbi:MAG: cupin domain-containing protein [Acidimicrobiia bacterium]|nr:cupin domain-containing protein [Acidimicrobiia bacterium]